MQTTPKDKILCYEKRGWWSNETLISILNANLKENPDQEALIDPPNRSSMVGGEAQRLSFREIDRLSDKLAHILFDLGLRQGDKAVVQMPNVVEIVLTYFAASKLGLVLSPVAMQYGKFELTYIDETLLPKAYIAFEDFISDNYGRANSMEILSNSMEILRFAKDLLGFHGCSQNFAMGLLSGGGGVVRTLLHPF